MASGMQVAYSGIKQNKKMLFAVIGFLSGSLGGLIAGATDLFMPYGSTGPLVILILLTSIWAGLFSAVIAVGLYWAIDVYSHRLITWPRLLNKGIPVGFIAGAISGAVTQIIYGPIAILIPNDLLGLLVGLLFQCACWGLLGLILGWRFSKAIPNLDAHRAIYAGFIGGFLGNFGFQIVAIFVPDILGRMLGIGIMGAALGLCLVIVEEISRVACVEVHWTPDEVSYFTLGSTPVFIGAGDSDIYVPTVVRHAMSLIIEGGQIFGTDHTKGKKKELFDGNHITIGKIDMIIRTGIEKMKASYDR